MKLIKHLALVGAVAFAPALAFAQAPAASGTPGAAPPAAAKADAKAAPAKGERHHQRGERFKAADKNGDGAISKSEADAAGMKRLSKNFDKVDANKDGKVTREEMRTARKDHRGEGKGRGPQGTTPATSAKPPAAK